MNTNMKQKKGKVGRCYLVDKLRESGLSRRRSVLVVNTILEAMTDALRRGEDVEFPFGQLSRIRRYFNKHWESADDWPADQNPYTVVYQLDMDAERRVSRKKLAAAGRARKSGK